MRQFEDCFIVEEYDSESDEWFNVCVFRTREASEAFVAGLKVDEPWRQFYVMGENFIDR